MSLISKSASITVKTEDKHPSEKSVMTLNRLSIAEVTATRNLLYPEDSSLSLAAWMEKIYDENGKRRMEEKKVTSNMIAKEMERITEAWEKAHPDKDADKKVAESVAKNKNN